MRALVISVTVAVLSLGQVMTSSVISSAAAQAPAASGTLSQANATKVAAKMGKSLELAIQQGLIAPAPGGTYVVTSAGASALGASGVALGPLAGLGALQITALIAGALALTLIGVNIDNRDDFVPPGAAPSTSAPSTTR